MEEIREIGVLFYCVSPQSVAKWLYLKMNVINISHAIKENEETYSYSLTTDHGLHYRPSVVSFVSTFFYYLFLPWA